MIILCNSLKAIDLIDNRSHDIKLKPVLGQAMEIEINDDEVDLLSLPKQFNINGKNIICLLYTSPSPRDCLLSRMPSSA